MDSTDPGLPAHDEGRDGTGPVTYTERLLPAWWLWLAVLAFAGAVGVAYGAAFGAVIGWAVFGAATLALGATMVVTSPILRIDDAVFRAGRARLPLRYVGEAVALDPEAAREIRGPRADARAFLVLRTWASPRAVKVTVTDAEDPHPYWVVSTRHPDRVVSALAAADRGAGTAAPG